MKLFLILTFSCFSAFAEQAEVESIKIGSNTYQKAVITKDSPLIAKITHSDGVSRVKIEDLPRDIQTQIGFDANEATEAKEKESIASKYAKSAAARLVARKAMIKAGLTYMAVVEDIHKSGIVANCKMTRIGQNPPKVPIFIETKTKSLTNGGSKVMNLVLSKETYTYTTVLGASVTLRKYRDIELILDEQFPDSAEP